MTNFESFDSLMARQPLPVREAVERRFQELRDSLSPPALDAPVAAPFDEAAALEHFSDYFRRNYPGPDTIIGRPDWHSPKIFRAALHAIKANASPVAAQAVTDGPTTLLRMAMERRGVAANPLEVPALLISEVFAVSAEVDHYPEIGRTELGDDFIVTHIPSGYRAARAPTMEAAIQAAKALAEIPVDWPNLTRETVGTIPRELKVQIDVIRAAASADGDIFTSEDLAHPNAAPCDAQGANHAD